MDRTPARAGTRLGRVRCRRGGIPLVTGLLLASALASPARAQAPADSLRVSWTDPGDDGLIGTAALIDLRRSSSPITLANWNQATLVPGVQHPGPAGTPEQFVVHGLDYGSTYYFALRVSDEAGNWSPLSNVAVWNGIVDTTPPSVPRTLAATLQGGTVHLTWTPDTEPDLAGYNVYRGAAAAGPYARVNSALVTAASFDDAPPPAVGGWWYQVTALDQAGNESAASTPVGAGLPGTSTIVMAPPYPNPSRRADAVQIPLVVGMSGAGVRIEIRDAAGQCVRRLDLGSIGAGNQEVTWDGKNDAGRLVAPGIYTAILTGHGLTGLARLVRLP